MKELSVSDVMALRPCYSEDKVNELFDGRDKLSLFDILNLTIPADDKAWVLTRPGVLSDALLKEFAALTADRAVRQYCLNCGVPEVEAWAAKWLDGSDRSADAAYWTTRGAAYEAARGAAWTAYHAAWAAAYGAACSAACSAVWAAKATGEADGAARAAAERQQQVDDLRRLINA